MQEVQLYIEGSRVDLFKDETISLTQTIQNIKDISKVFTDFSKSFNVPASKTNNKLFSHYYNSDIEGFDARTKKDANIELNHLPFRDGKIKLNGVKLKNNKPHSYNITFFGNTVNLKDLLGDDQIDQLPLSTYDHDFDIATVKTGLETNLISSSIVYPLLTHSKRYIYDSTASVHTDGNIAFHSGDTHGVIFFDLKPALRVDSIIQSIESRYGITFSSDFFDTSVDAFSNLYLWLHRAKGRVGATSTGEEKVSVPSGFAHLSGDDYVSFVSSNSIFAVVTGTAINFATILTITPTETSEKYDIKVTDEITGDILHESLDNTNVQNKNINLPSTVSGSRSYEIKVTITTEAGLIEYDAKWNIILKVNNIPYQDGTYQTSDIQMTSRVVIAENLPKIKVIDFLTGLFKMFNLTAYVDSSGTIVVKTLDSFYATGTSYDITKYVDVKGSDINSALPYKEITFKYSEPKTFLANQFSELNNKEFSELKYDGGTKLDGGKYDIKLPFEKVIFERLNDENGGAVTDAQYGYFVDGKQEPLLAKPLLFYNINTSVGAKSIGFVNGTAVSISTYNRPSNTNEVAPADYTLNFGSEFDEFDPSLGLNNNSLFEKFYRTYIVDNFNAKNRITKVTAFLPLRISLNYTLADRFIYNGRSYKINSINTDLQSGKSQIELLNDFT